MPADANTPLVGRLVQAWHTLSAVAVQGVRYLPTGQVDELHCEQVEPSAK